MTSGPAPVEESFEMSGSEVGSGDIRPGEDRTGKYSVRINQPTQVAGGSGTDTTPGPLPGWGGARGVQINLDGNGNGSSRGGIDDPGELRWFQINGVEQGNLVVQVTAYNGTSTAAYQVQVIQSTDDHLDAPIFQRKLGQTLDATTIFLNHEKFQVAGTVEEREGALKFSLFREGEPITGYASTNGNPDGMNLRGFKLNENQTTEPKGLSSDDARARTRLTNGNDYIEIEWKFKSRIFQINTAGSSGIQHVDISVPPDQVPDGPLEVRERDGHIEVLHNGQVKLTLFNQTIRAGSFFTFEAAGLIAGGTPMVNPPQYFDAFIDDLVFCHDSTPNNLQVTPSLQLWFCEIPRAPLHQRVHPLIQMPAADVRPDVADLLLTGSPDFVLPDSRLR